MQIENLDLLIGGSSIEGYNARVTASARGRSQTASPFLQADAAGKLTHNQVTIPTSFASLRDPAVQPEQVGEALYSALTSDNTIQDFFTSALVSAQEQKRRVRLRFQIEPQDLRRLPVEMLYRSPGGFLALSPHVSIARYIAAGVQPQRTLIAEPPLRIALVSAEPAGLPTLNAAGEIARIHKALAALEQSGRVKVFELVDPTLASLRATLRTEQIHVLHFIGHGAFSDTRPLLVFADPVTHAVVEVDADTLATAMAGIDSLRLAVLNACEGGIESTIYPLMGVASKLMQRAALPAALAMQDIVLDSSAIAFAEGFYAELARGGEIDAAVYEGRMAVFTAHAAHIPMQREFGVPVLFVSASDSRLIDFPERQQERILYSLGAHMRDPGTTLGDWQPLLQTLKTVYERLVAWKTIHDQLHTIHNSLDLVWSEYQRLVTTAGTLDALNQIWRIIQRDFEVLKALAANPPAVLNAQPLQTAPDGTLTGPDWAVPLLALRTQIDAALQRDDRTLTGRLLRQLHSSLQTRLNLTDKQIMAQAEALPRPIVLPGELDDNRADAEAQLTTLHQQIFDQAKLHDYLQDALVNFEPVRIGTRGTPGSWDITRLDTDWHWFASNSLESVLRPFADQQNAFTEGQEATQGDVWAVSLFTAAERVGQALNVALETGSFATLGEAVRQFDGQLTGHFFQADQRLLLLSQQLQALLNHFDALAKGAIK